LAEPGTTVGSWLLDVVGTQFRRGETIYPRRRYVDIVGGATIEDDPVRNSTKLTLTGGGTGVGSDRVINGTSPIRINGGASATLAADLTVSVLDATTGAVGVVRMTNDLAGTGAAPVVARINGATVPAAGALTPGNVLQVSAVAALVYAAVNLAGGANYVINRLPIANIGFGNADTVLTTNAAGSDTLYRKIVNANVDDAAAIAVAKLAPGTDGQFLRTVTGVPTWSTVTVGSGGVTPGTDGQIFVTTAGPTSGWATAGGDWDGAVTANVVRRLRGAAIGSAAGALTTGTVLRVTGASTIDYGAVNLANEAAVTGALAIAHIAPHSSNPAILITNGAGATEWSTTIPGGLFPNLAGDANGSPGANTVDRIRGAAVGTAAGALVTGQSLRVTGVSTADWGPIDLANTNAITGLLPIVRIAPTGTNRVLIVDGAGVVTWSTSLALTMLAPGGAATGQLLGFNGTNWAPTSLAGASVQFQNVASIADMQALPVTTLSDGVHCWVRSVKRVYILDTNAITPDPANDTYVSATAGRNWMGAAA
jgi:hypothetical protein